MPYQEKDFQSAFNRWCKHIYPHTAAFELKITKDSSLPFSAVKEHQEIALHAAKHGKMVYKIPDDSRGFKPFDSFMLTGTPAYVVIMFNAPSRDFYMIDIDEWFREKAIATRKSITLEKAKQIGLSASLKADVPFSSIDRTALSHAPSC